MHLNWETTARTVTQLPENDLALMRLRLTFGGLPGPFEWGIILETVCNLTTAIRQNDDWEQMKTFGRNQHLVPPPKFLEDSISFAEGLELVVDIPINSRGILDIYIDNLVSLAVEI